MNITCHCNTQSPGNKMWHIGIWGESRAVDVNQCLGVGVKPPKGRGIRKAIYDAAFGVVSGYRFRDIAYYVITRSISSGIRNLALRSEKPKRDAEYRSYLAQRESKVAS